MNLDYPIVNLASITVYDFLKDNETKEEGEKRGSQYYKEELNHIKDIFKKYGGTYWKQELKEAQSKTKRGCKVMTYKEYKALERNKLLNGKIVEVTKEQFNDMLNVLPPLHWTTHNNVEMFCMCEMYTGSFTTQYAHDRKIDKYYSTMVDANDRSTWICELLKKVA